VEGRVWAAVDRKLSDAGGTTHSFYPVANDRGDVVELLDGDHLRFAGYRYDVYGRPTETSVRTTPSDAMSVVWAEAICARNVLRYAAYTYDTHSGLYYLQRRSYDPLTRQFLSRDPLRADGEESPYQYCAGMPVAMTDPLGLAQVQGSGAGGGQQQSTTLKHLYRLRDLRLAEENYYRTYEKTYTVWSGRGSHAVKGLPSGGIDSSTLAAGGKGFVNFSAGFGDAIVGFVGLHIDQPYSGPGLDASYMIGQADSYACQLVAGGAGMKAAATGVKGAVTGWLGTRAARAAQVTYRGRRAEEVTAAIKRGASRDELMQLADDIYPKLRGTQGHHNTPMYLGGDAAGPITELPSAYHQLITNYFRSLVPYRSGPLDAAKARSVCQQVYRVFPLD
jgi:RHS repeat-associated protein